MPIECRRPSRWCRSVAVALALAGLVAASARADDTITPPAAIDVSLGQTDAAAADDQAAAPTSIVIVAEAKSKAPKPAVPDDEHEILLLQALDEPTDLDVTDVPISEAVDLLAKQTGIPIAIEPDVFDLLPYGSRTTLSATIKDQPLAESLRSLLRPLGLTFEPGKRKITIKPTPPLRRVVRRATWEEVGTLEALYSQPWSDELFESLHFQFQDAAAGEADASRATLERLATGVGAGSAAEVLEHACDQYGWTWYPLDRNIAVLTKTRQIERQLHKRVTLRYNEISLNDALLDLTSRAGVLLRLDPGALASLPPQTAERFSLSIENATILQALEVVAGQTGLGYFIEPDGVRMTANMLGPSASGGTDPIEAVTNATIRAIRSSIIVGHITIPNPDGSSYSFFIYESDLPPEVNRLRKAKIREAVNAIGKALRAEQPQD